MINVRRALTGFGVNSDKHDELPTFVIHLTILAIDEDAASRLARQICASLGHIRELDAGLTAVSSEGDITHQDHVFCDMPTIKGRCALSPGHDGKCGERP